LVKIQVSKPDYLLYWQKCKPQLSVAINKRDE